MLKGKLVLQEFGQTQVAVNRDIATRGLQRPIENLHKCGLTTTVGTNQTISSTFAKFNRDVFKERFGIKLHGDIGTGNQKGSARWRIEGNVSERTIMGRR